MACEPPKGGNSIWVRLYSLAHPWHLAGRHQATSDGEKETSYCQKRVKSTWKYPSQKEFTILSFSY